MPGKPATMSQPSTIPPLATDAEAEAFLGQDLSGLDFSAFKPVRFEFAGEEPAVNLRMPAGAAGGDQGRRGGARGAVSEAHTGGVGGGGGRTR